MECFVTLPHYPRATLFAASLAKDLKAIAEEIEGECATLRINSERFFGLPRRVDIGGIKDISQDLGRASLRLETQMRRLRSILTELRDFFR
jgi:hypothetical protein